METKKAGRSLLPVIVFFIITNSLFLSLRSRFERWDTDTDVLIIGNVVLFIATLISFYLYNKSMSTKNAHAIVRMVYAGVLSKMMICLVGIFIYIIIAGKGVNKGGIFGCMFLYIVYSVIEVAALLKLSKQNKNA
jgi:hypothetical protein